VRFTLEERASREGAIDEWRGHVDPDADVRDRGAMRGARRDLLNEFLGLMRQYPDVN